MPRIRRLLPEAYILVDEKEADAYAEVVPDELLLTHPHLNSLPKIRNWILDQSDVPVVIQIDDDLQCVESLVWPKKRTITDPVMIRQILENGVNIMCDLRKQAFCWSRVRMSAGGFYDNCRPFALASAISCTFVMRTDGRIRFDEQIHGKADIDLTLQLLLHDRIVLQDRRLHFNHGNIDGVPGGATGTRTEARIAEVKKILRRKWGPYVKTDARSSVSNMKSTSGRSKTAYNTSTRIVVRRRSTLSGKERQR